MRLDRALATLLPDLSRSRLKALIETGAVGLEAGGYVASISRQRTVLDGVDDAGTYYAAETFRQLFAGRKVVSATVRDWPDFAVRGYMLDVSRDRVPTRETLERLVGLCASARINHLELYTEHTFAYRDHEAVWRDASPITPDDVEWLDATCAAAGIDLVANQNCFGHMARWLAHDEYRWRAEAPDGFEPVPGFRMPPSVLAPNPENAAFAHALFAELLPNFRSRRVNINCDETFDLGVGVSLSGSRGMR